MYPLTTVSTNNYKTEGFTSLAAIMSQIGTSAHWQERAVNAYRASQAGRRGALQTELAHRIQALTNYRPAPESIYADEEKGLAVYKLDQTLFRLGVEGLSIVRSCAHCGTGEFVSLPIMDIADLGHAIAVWQPHHEDCEPEDDTDIDF